jgi:hypothetical protein
MQSLPYSSLTNEQRARVDYLFADAIFGTDASAFVYEWDGKDIKGRTSNQLAVTSRARKLDPASVKVTMVQEVNITNELIQSANMHMDALAALIARKIYQSQFEEVSA